MPTDRERLLFALALGALSTGFAEVLSGNQPFPFFTPSGLLVIVPIYLLHALFFFTVVSLSGRFRLSTLYLAGVLFGLYEAYLVKVVWEPTWDPIPFEIGGVHVVETGMLILFWHPIMSFVLPLAVAERALTRSSFVVDGLPPRLRRRLLQDRRVAAAAIAGAALLVSVSRPNPLVLLLSLVGNAAVIVALLAYWRRRVGTEHELGDFVPTRRQFGGVTASLCLLYVVLGVSLRPEAIPPFVPGQLLVVLLYLAFGGLLAVNVRRVRARVADERPAATGARSGGDRRAPLPGRRRAAAYGLCFLAVALAATLLHATLVGPIYLGFVIVAVACGIALVGHSVRDTWAMAGGRDGAAVG